MVAGKVCRQEKERENWRYDHGNYRKTEKKEIKLGEET